MTYKFEAGNKKYTTRKKSTFDLLAKLNKKGNDIGFASVMTVGLMTGDIKELS